MDAPGPTPARPVIGESGVQRIAELARLRVPAEQVAPLAQHFERMLDFVDTLNEVDVTDVKADIHQQRGAELLRDDRPRDAGFPGGPLDREAVLDNAPAHEGPYFATPRVV